MREADSMINAQPKPQRETSEDYKAWIRTQPCVVFGKYPHICVGFIEANHIREDGHGGLSTKPDDTRCVPNCSGSHREYHAFGKKAFETKYGIDLESEICRLLVLYRPKPKRVLKKQPQATVQITGCICGKIHILSFSRADITRDVVYFKCPLRNEEVSAKMKGIR